MINKGYANEKNYPKDDRKQSVRICMHHFHPSTWDVNEKGKIVLKIIKLNELQLAYSLHYQSLDILC